jgi:integration host factor subunit beta|tara:strand:+ start:43 stop:324 length:282 start_codon:yes stop_codon:yes gene_type:complete
LSRPELIKQLKQKNPELNQSDLDVIVDVFCNSIEKALKNGKNVELRGFGTFFVKKIKEKYSARNPKTGELIYVPKKNKVRFRASKKLKDFINK